jgi:hypothetical protein
MKRNIELLTRVRDLVRDEESKLDMDSWAAVAADSFVFPRNRYTAKVSCCTTACVAGWAVQLAGDKLLVNACRFTEEDGYYVDQSVAKNGRVFDIGGRARKLLGLTDSEADILFMELDASEVGGCLDRLIAGEQIDYDPDYEIDPDY